MKKYLCPFIIAGIFAVSTSTTQAQNTFPATGNVGIGTTSPTQALTIAASNFQTFYNTTDQTTNYERAILGWNTNIFQIALGNNGTGTARNMQFGAASTFINFGFVSATGSAMELRRDNTSSSTLFAVTSAGLQSSSGTQNGIAVVPTLNQSGTAGYRGLWISPFESAIGSGSKYLIDAGTNSAVNGAGTHTSKFTVDDNGNGNFAQRLVVGDIVGRNATLALVPATFSTGGTYSTSGFGLQVGPTTYTSATSTGTIAAQGTNTFGIPTLAATNVTTLTNASTLYIAGAPASGTNVTITNPFALYVNAGDSYLGGAVGIGTTNLFKSFTVEAGNVTGINQGLVINSAHTYGTGQGAAGSALVFSRNRVTDVSALEAEAQIVGGNYNETSSQGGYLGFYTNNTSNVLTEAMHIDINQRVGIGTASPQNTLDVNGTVHSKSVSVDLNGWPDFVFEPAYQLPSLDAVKTYIDQKHHLPDMPSAEEVKKDGLNLGEVNKQLTKKVEELTLYLIELSKQVKEQQKEIEQLKRKL